jgi:hypothetical protein
MTHPSAPVGTIAPIDVALFASGSSGNVITIAGGSEGVNVFESTGPAFSVVACSGGGNIVLNQNVDCGSVWAVGTVDFPGTATVVVHGDLRVTVSNDSVASQVTGTRVSPTTINHQTTTIVATFPVLSGSPFSISSGTQTISAGAITSITVTGGTLTINPGSYGNLQVSGGTVIMTAGTYTFTDASFSNTSTFSPNTTGGAIRINVRNTLIFRANCSTTNFNPANLRWAVFGAGGAQIGVSTTSSNVYRGSVVAMNGPLIIDDSSRMYRGAFFGLTVTVNGTAPASLPTIQHVGFAFWEAPT